MKAQDTSVFLQQRKTHEIGVNYRMMNVALSGLSGGWSVFSVSVTRRVQRIFHNLLLPAHLLE